MMVYCIRQGEGGHNWWKNHFPSEQAAIICVDEPAEVISSGNMTPFIHICCTEYGINVTWLEICVIDTVNNQTL